MEGIINHNKLRLRYRWVKLERDGPHKLVLHLMNNVDMQCPSRALLGKLALFIED